MQSRRLSSILAALALVVVVVALVCSLTRRSTGKSAITIGVIRYDTWNNGASIAARVGITNLGRIAIHYRPFDPVVRIESPTGWTAALSLPSGLLFRAVLRPGSNNPSRVVLPVDTLRWQVSYKMTLPSEGARCFKAAKGVAASPRSDLQAAVLRQKTRARDRERSI